MPATVFDLAELRRILRDVGGTAPGVDLEADILDTSFDELGYDSLALMEAAARIQQEFGVRLDDDTVFETSSPRGLLAAVSTVSAVR
jgi:act minimal PKS acyl carrier protein